MSQQPLPGIPHTSYRTWLIEQLGLLYPDGKGGFDQKTRVVASDVEAKTWPLVPFELIPSHKLAREFHGRKLRAVLKSLGAAAVDDHGTYAVQMELDIDDFTDLQVGKLKRARADVARVVEEVRAYAKRHTGTANAVADVDAFVERICASAGIRAA